MANDLIRVVSRDDELKSAIISNLKRCEIELDGMEVMALELYCNFEARPDNPDLVTYKAVCSRDFPDEIVEGNLKDLINSDELKEIRELKSELNIINYQHNSGNDHTVREFNRKRADFWNNFINRIRTNLVCVARALDFQEQKYIFLMAKLEEHTSWYKGIVEYVLDGICTELDSIEAISGFLASSFFLLKMSNKRVLFGDYVDHFLKKNELPQAEVLIELSAEKYEGSESEARIYFDCQDMTNLGILDEFGRESRIIRSENRRMIRKMMEISKKGIVHLYAERKGGQDNRYCLITKLVKGEKDKGLYINFFGYLCWSVVCDGNEKIIYERGRYILNPSDKEKEHIVKTETLKRKIGETSMIPKLRRWFDQNWLNELIEILRDQKHGTAVILTNCKGEAKRLCELNRGTLVHEDMGICRSKIGWKREELLSATSIDGALFMDLDGVCMALGVIVDGKAKRIGDTGKGARYNSIVNYVRQKARNSIYLGIIVSEDGMIELTCNLEEDEET